VNFYDLFGSGNAAGGLRMQSGTGMNLYGGQPSSNLGLTMPKNPYADMETGTGIMPPSSFGEMPTGFDWQSGLGMLGSMLGKKQQQVQPQMKPVELPMGSNQSYEQLLKMYGVRSGGLLG
jgi:hypothetical protein